MRESDRCSMTDRESRVWSARKAWVRGLQAALHCVEAREIATVRSAFSGRRESLLSFCCGRAAFQ